MMSDRGTSDDDRESRVSRRRASLEGGAGGRVAHLLIGAVLAIAFAAFALMLLMPGQVQRLFAAAPSEAEDMQQASDDTMGLSTEITVEVVPGLEPAQPLQTESAFVAAPAGAGDEAARQAEIDALRKELAELRSSSSQGAESLRALLAEQTATLQEQFDRERALLEERHQQELRDAAMTTPLPAGIGIGLGGGENEAEAEARRRLEEERARRAEIAAAQIASDGIVLDASGRTASTTSAGTGAGEEDASRDLTSNEAFIEEASARSYDTVRATQIADPGRTIVQGTTLNATLETAIGTEMPGLIRAVVSDDVLSYDGLNVLLPRGTRLIGNYNSDVSVVQDRVQLAWSRAVTPKGISVELGGYGADTLGRSGQEGEVDGRFRQRFGSAALISLLGSAPEVVVGERTGALGQDVAEDLGGDLQSSAQSVMGDYLAAPPVISVEQGTPLTVIVNRDLIF